MFSEKKTSLKHISVLANFSLGEKHYVLVCVSTHVHVCVHVQTLHLFKKQAVLRCVKQTKVLLFQFLDKN
jgi:hypothetical protein